MKQSFSLLSTAAAVLVTLNSYGQWLPGGAVTATSIYRTGKVAIGNGAAMPTPGAQLMVYSGDSFGGTVANNILLTSFSGNCGTTNTMFHNTWLVRKSTGTGWSSVAMHDGISVDVSFLTPGTDTRTWWERNPILDIQTWGNSATTHMELNAGNLYIGAGRPKPGGVAAAAKLSVDGMILAKDIRVATSIVTHWADFVFEKNYKLMPLKDVSAYIAANKHLPEIPTTAEVREDGIDLVDMNVKLLQKVEELFLHTIELQKQLDAQQKQIETLKAGK